MRSIYVAGGSDERGACQKAIEALEAEGWEVTFNWIKNPGDVDGDIKGVLSADVLWVRLPDAKSEGSHAELGIALGAKYSGGGKGRLIIVSGGHSSLGRIFPSRADLQFDTHDMALDWLMRIAP